jgi:acylphosphatase
VIAEGTAASCARLVDILRGDDTAGRVDEVLVGWEEPSGSFRGFGIR